MQGFLKENKTKKLEESQSLESFENSFRGEEKKNKKAKAHALEILVCANILQV